MRKSEKFASWLLKPINTSVVILLGGYTMLWGFWVANPFWSVFTHSDLYAQMASLAPEWAWGVLAMLCGLSTLYGILRPSYRTLTTGAAVLGLFWFIIGLMYFMGAWQSTGGITSMAFALYSAYIYENIKVNKNRLDLSNDEANDMLREKNY